jgi:hypothetical protein
MTIFIAEHIMNNLTDKAPAPEARASQDSVSSAMR